MARAVNLKTVFLSLKRVQLKLRYKRRSGNFIINYSFIIFSCRKLSWEWREACCSETCWPQNSGRNQLLILHLQFMNMIHHEKVVFMKNPKTAEASRTFWENLANELRHSTLFFIQNSAQETPRKDKQTSTLQKHRLWKIDEKHKATIKDSGLSHVKSETQLKDSGHSHDEHIKTQSVTRPPKNSGRRWAHSHLSFEREQNTKSSQFSKTGPPRRLQMKP